MNIGNSWESEANPPKKVSKTHLLCMFFFVFSPKPRETTYCHTYVTSAQNPIRLTLDSRRLGTFGADGQVICRT